MIDPERCCKISATNKVKDRRGLMYSLRAMFLYVLLSFSLINSKIKRREDSRDCCLRYSPCDPVPGVIVVLIPPDLIIISVL